MSRWCAQRDDPVFYYFILTPTLSMQEATTASLQIVFESEVKFTQSLHDAYCALYDSLCTLHDACEVW